MAELSTYAENAIVNWLRGATTMPAETAAYVALFTADGGLEAGTMDNEVPNANAYARTAAAIGVAADGVGTNAAAITFPAASGGNWGTITHAALVDDNTWGGGNVIMHSALAVNVTVNDGDTFQINATKLTVTIT